MWDKNYIIFLVLLTSLYTTQNSFAQATFTDNSTPTQLANQIGGPGVTLSNEVLTSGTGSMVAIFSNGTVGANLGIDEGIFLGTTAASEAFTSNDNSALSLSTGTTYSDPDLLLIDPGNVFDVVIFEVDVTLDAGISDLAIDFQFASDEYPEYVCSPFNDGFGFFVSGPGISGTQNIALVPGSGNPVAVNSINGGSPGLYANGTPCDLGQSADFINNGNGVAGSVYTEFNGITKLLTGELTGLQAGGTYHFKLAIADAGDPTYDSGVFVSIIYSPTVAEAMNCGAGNSAPLLSATTLSNICNATTADLDGLHTGSIPTDASLVWSTDNDASDGLASTESSPTNTSGTYYAYYYHASDDCYSPASSAVTVTILECCAVDGLTPAIVLPTGTNQ